MSCYKSRNDDSGLKIHCLVGGGRWEEVFYSSEKRKVLARWDICK